MWFVNKVDIYIVFNRNFVGFFGRVRINVLDVYVNNGI